MDDRLSLGVSPCTRLSWMLAAALAQLSLIGLPNWTSRFLYGSKLALADIHARGAGRSSIVNLQAHRGA